MITEMKNPYILAPIKLGYTRGDGQVNDRHLDFYAVRSRYLGAVIPEPFYLSEGLRELPTQLGIDKDDKIPGLRKLTDSFHRFHTRAIAHLNHPGRMANPTLKGNYHVSASAIACENGGATPRAMTYQDMKLAVSQFAGAAIRAEKAGFDALELQFGHGYLLAQFISPLVNQRNDRYGGSFENRIRFPLEVYEAVRNSVNIPVIARISGDEMVEGGIGLEEMRRFARILEQKNIEAIHVSAGSVCSTPPWFFQHMFVPKGKTWEMARRIQEDLHTPVIFVGRIHSKEDIERLHTEYKADYMAVGRAMVADPDFIGKYLGAVEGKIRPCLACAEGCLGGVKSGRGLHCVVNPRVGNDFESPGRSGRGKHYAVVGGGLAGMEAALNLKARGDQVVIYEKEQLGGQFNLAYLPPQKESLKEILDFFITEVRDKNIPVIHEEAQSEKLLNNGYDEVILATGARPAIPPVKGLDRFYWTEFLSDENLPEDQRVLVIGGGLIGVEVASKLVDRNNHVIIVEMMEDLARGMEMIEKKMTLAKLNKHQAEIYTGTRVEEVRGKQIVLAGENQELLENIDKIVVAAGMKSYNPLEDKLKPHIPVRVIGDAKKARKAQDAIKEGYLVAIES
jgi:2,4-dienoyl-CoA reductase-like NADH-dependent reductase (Old Yellow Enzyme family)